MTRKPDWAQGYKAPACDSTPAGPPKDRGLAREMSLAVPPAPPKPAPPPNVVATPPWDRMRPGHRELMLWVYCIPLSLVAAGVWLLTAWRSQLGLTVINYATLIALCVCVTAAVTRLRLRVPIFLAIAGGITLPAVFIHGWLDRYTEQWNTITDSTSWDDEDDSLMESTYHDTYRRWSGTIVYRRIRMVGRANGQVVFSTLDGGPMSPSGKPHGKWLTRNKRPPSDSYPTWFWYGEEISEGQWHLLNER